MPSFKSNIDLEQNQLLNAVLENQPDMPQNPVEGQLYYNSGKHTAYLWTGSFWTAWGEYSAGQTQQTMQYLLSILNPSIKSAMVFVRLFETQTVVRIDSHFSGGDTVAFNIKNRDSVNDSGITLTDEPILAVHDGTETTTFSISALSAGNWLYFELFQKDGEILPKEEEPAAEAGGGESAAAPADTGFLGLLSITITCVTG